MRTRPRDDEIVERPQRLLDRRHRVEAVNLIEVDMVEAEPLQAAGDLIHDVPAREADRIGAGAGAAANLGGHDDVLALDGKVAQGLAEHDFRLSLGIDVGGVDEIDARFERALNERGRALLLDRADIAPEAGAAMKGHRPQAYFRDELAGAAKRAVFHRRIPFWWSCRCADAERSGDRAAHRQRTSRRRPPVGQGTNKLSVKPARPKGVRRRAVRYAA